MKKFLFIGIALIFNIATQAQVYVESENDVTFTKSGVTPSLSLYAQKNFSATSKFGFSSYLFVQPTWAEVTSSVTYTHKNFSYSLGLGMETIEPHWRVVAGVVYADSTNLIKAFYEQGGGKDNWWYHVSYDKSIGKVKVGVMSRRFYGTGVKLGYSLSDNISITIAPLWDFESKQYKQTFFLTYTL